MLRMWIILSGMYRFVTFKSLQNLQLGTLELLKETVTPFISSDATLSNLGLSPKNRLLMNQRRIAVRHRSSAASKAVEKDSRGTRLKVHFSRGDTVGMNVEMKLVDLEVYSGV